MAAAAAAQTSSRIFLSQRGSQSELGASPLSGTLTGIAGFNLSAGLSPAESNNNTHAPDMCCAVGLLVGAKPETTAKLFN